MMIKKYKYSSGFSLFETMVVIVIFALLAVLVTQSLTMSIRGSKKSESVSRARSTLSNAIGVIERQLRNANEIIDCGEETPNAGLLINYKDEFGNAAYFQCNNDPGAGYIASGSGTLSINLISSSALQDVVISNCQIECIETEDIPTTVNVTLGVTGQFGGVGTSEVTVQSKIMLRNY